MAHERIACGCCAYLWSTAVLMSYGRNHIVKCRMMVSVVRFVMYERLSGSWVWKRKVS